MTFGSVGGWIAAFDACNERLGGTRPLDLHSAPPWWCAGFMTCLSGSLHDLRRALWGDGAAAGAFAHSSALEALEAMAAARPHLCGTPVSAVCSLVLRGVEPARARQVVSVATGRDHLV